jgi:hypothetical protein
MSIIDINGILSFFDLDIRKPDGSGKLVVGEHLAYERKVSPVASFCLSSFSWFHSPWGLCMDSRRTRGT